MKFTTPATASEPYTAEAPSASTSMRCIAEVGMMFGSVWLNCAPPPGMRMPSMTTSVVFEDDPPSWCICGL
jgi:hypothetical protein